MRTFPFNRLLSICVLSLGISGLTFAQSSSTEQAVVDKILKLKGQIDQVMMKPGASADQVAMDKVMQMKRDIDTLLDLLPPQLQAQVQKKMGQSQALGEGAADVAETENLPFVMGPQDVQKVERVLMRSHLNALKQIGGALRQKGTLDAQTQAMWVQVMENIVGSGTEADVQLMTKYVMKEAYAKENEGLDLLGGKVRFYQNLRAKLREEMAKVKKATQAVPGDDGPLPEAMRKKQFSMGLNGDVAIREGDEVAAKTGALQYLAELENQLATTNENAEKAALELEDALLKQQPKLKAMSEVSQKLQDAGNAAVQSGP